VSWVRFDTEVIRRRDLRQAGGTRMHNRETGYQLRKGKLGGRKQRSPTFRTVAKCQCGEPLSKL